MPAIAFPALIGPPWLCGGRGEAVIGHGPDVLFNGPLRPFVFIPIDKPGHEWPSEEFVITADDKSPR